MFYTRTVRLWCLRIYRPAKKPHPFFQSEPLQEQQRQQKENHFQRKANNIWYAHNYTIWSDGMAYVPFVLCVSRLWRALDYLLYHFSFSIVAMSSQPVLKPRKTQMNREIIIGMKPISKRRMRHASTINSLTTLQRTFSDSEGQENAIFHFSTQNLMKWSGLKDVEFVQGMNLASSSCHFGAELDSNLMKWAHRLFSRTSFYPILML